MRQQLTAGYRIEEVIGCLSPTAAPIAQALLRSLAYFDLESNWPLPVFDAE